MARDEEMDEIWNNRDYIYSIPEKILFDVTLTVEDLRVYALIRSLMDFRGYISPTDREINFISFTGYFSPDNKLTEALKMKEKEVIDCVNKLIEKDYFYVIDEKHITI